MAAKFQRVKPRSRSKVLRLNGLIIILVVVIMFSLDFDLGLRKCLTVDVCLLMIFAFAAINFAMRLETKHYLASRHEQEFLFPDSRIESEKASKRPPESS